MGLKRGIGPSETTEIQMPLFDFTPMVGYNYVKDRLRALRENASSMARLPGRSVPNSVRIRPPGILSFHMPCARHSSSTEHSLRHRPHPDPPPSLRAGDEFFASDRGEGLWRGQVVLLLSL
jgi:hypothetical protein